MSSMVLSYLVRSICALLMLTHLCYVFDAPIDQKPMDILSKRLPLNELVTRF